MHSIPNTYVHAKFFSAFLNLFLPPVIDAHRLPDFAPSKFAAIYFNRFITLMLVCTQFPKCKATLFTEPALRQKQIDRALMTSIDSILYANFRSPRLMTFNSDFPHVFNRPIHYNYCSSSHATRARSLIHSFIQFSPLLLSVFLTPLDCRSTCTGIQLYCST